MSLLEIVQNMTSSRAAQFDNLNYLVQNGQICFNLRVIDSNLDLFLQDLVGAEPEKRNWKGIALALLTICFVFFLVFMAVLVLTPDPVDTGSIDITNLKLNPSKAKTQWLSSQFSSNFYII